MGLGIFLRHVKDRLTQPLMNSQDMGVALALYLVYPAILWLLIDKFHGICGAAAYARKAEAVAANDAVFLPFTALLRSYKIATILLFQADAARKQEDDYVKGSNSSSGDFDEGCTWLKCRVWFHLTQELVGIFCVAFLLLICLPVLAFWFMMLGIVVTCFNIYLLLRRLWRDAHTEAMIVAAVNNEEEDVIFDTETYGEEGEDLEFQEFLTNFAGDRNATE
ncbi:hypothetical protein IV203_028830 [Nitzschia inconspicua]|uniref:Uncharacterized protein n=1 Tax=Nitzschia inconspicua TaxID=303405 RepID=A0A9K3K908_9STRA|nr:hypothetical protein IV203_004766 [Nitzschia inconspicua]KAG7366160.1 hypothetical protein IV203_028830 [Nitzschia inconspicua]